MELQQFILTLLFFFLIYSRAKHRLYSLLDYDRVVIMEKGKIIEDGNPKELKSNPNSTFYTMLNASDLKPTSRVEMK
jgi:ABC-type transport system involved in cytochrome bd biosynthesis fused ATPase/permease subunit